MRPRLFWVHPEATDRNISGHYPIYSAVDVKPENQGWIPVIAKFAYDNAMKEIDRFSDEYANVCKFTNDLEVQVVKLKEEIETLKVRDRVMFDQSTKLVIENDELIVALRDMYECALFDSNTEDFQVDENDTSALGEAKRLLKQYGGK